MKQTGSSSRKYDFKTKVSQLIRLGVSAFAVLVFNACQGEPEFSAPSTPANRGDSPSIPPMDSPSPLLPQTTWSFENSSPQANPLFGIWVAPGSSIEKDQIYGVGDVGTILIGNSLSWQMPQVRGLGQKVLHAVSGQTAAGAVLMVGSSDAAILKTKNQWVDVSPVLGTGVGAFFGVWASLDPDQFFVVGNAGRIYRVTDQGKTWHQEATKLTNISLRSVFGRGQGPTMEVWAVGDGNVFLHRDPNGNWTTETSNGTQKLFGISGQESPMGDVYAVGVAGSIIRRNSAGSYTDETSNWLAKYPQYKISPPNLRAVTQIGDDVFVVGSKGIILRHNVRTSEWVDESNTGQTDDLYAIWAGQYGGRTVVYALGDHGTILCRESGAWSLISSTFSKENLSSVWAQNDSNVYAVGSNSTILGRHSDLQGKITWSQEAFSFPITTSFSTISGFVPTGYTRADVWAVGTGGTIVHRTFQLVNNVLQPVWNLEAAFLTIMDLKAVWVGNNSLVYVAGNQGRIEKRTADTRGNLGIWAPELETVKDELGNTVLVKQDLYTIWGDSSQDDPVMYFGGSDGLILRRTTDGKYQQDGKIGSAKILSIFGSSEQDLYALWSDTTNPSGGLLHRQNGQWVPVIDSGKSVVTAPALGTTAIDRSTSFILGNAGRVFAHGDTNWLEDSTAISTNQPLHAIAAIDANNMYVVGDNGLILHKRGR